MCLPNLSYKSNIEKSIFTWISALGGLGMFLSNTMSSEAFSTDFGVSE
jgi:hypothetical protein